MSQPAQSSSIDLSDLPAGVLDGVMVALCAGEAGHDEVCWREAACGTVSFYDREGEWLKTLMSRPHAQKRQA